MVQNKLEGKRYIGIIVAGGDQRPDPKKMGRVKVAVPQIMSPNIDVDKLPWCQLGSTANDNGSMTFDRPPQEGTMVSIYYPPGSKSSARGVVEFVYNGIREPRDMPGNTTLFDKGWFKRVLNIKPNINGFAKSIQTQESNETGAEKITTTVQNKSITSLAERIGIPSNLIAKSLMPYYDKVSNVATAKLDNALSMTTSLASMIPGTIANLSDLLNSLPSELLNNSENGKAIQNLFAIASESNPLSGTNFAQLGKRVDMDTFTSNAENLLNQAQDFGDLDDAITQLQTDDTLNGTENLEDQTINIEGPFGTVQVTVGKDGSISNESSQLITQAITAFLNFLSGIEVATGTLLGNSEILTDNYKRLPVAAQSAFKNAVGDQIPVKIGSVIQLSKSYLG